MQACLDLQTLTDRIAGALANDDHLTLTNLQCEELKAAVSHWLWDSKSLPPFFTPEIRLRAISHIRAEHPELLTAKGSLRTKLIGFNTAPYCPAEKPKFKFIDLFAGIGGFRIAMQDEGGKCVFSSEWDKFAKETYRLNFGEVPYGDIHRVDPNEIPDHDILCAGFPCQPFSLAGVSKNESLGRLHGFEHATQGTLFFEICKIIKAKRPKAFFLENVKNLLSHDGGRTFETIRSALVDELGYVMEKRVVDGGNWVPQHRERVFIIGFDPKQTDVSSTEEITIPGKPEDDYKYPELRRIIRQSVEEKYTLGPGTWDTLERHKAKHAKAGNGFGYGIHQLPLKKEARTRTISARYHKDGAEILIAQDGKRPRRLTVDEAKQLQGYDLKKFRFEVSNTQAYRQIGNSVVVPAIKASAKELVKTLSKKRRIRK